MLWTAGCKASLTLFRIGQYFDFIIISAKIAALLKYVV